MNIEHPWPGTHGGSFSGLKLGALPPRHDARTLQFAKYVDDAVVLPTIPHSFSLTTQVPSWPMYGNDRLGDCTFAAAGHMIEAWTEAAGALRTPTDAAVEAAYWATGDHKDTGRVELDVLNYWRHPGIDGDRIGAYVAIDPSNHKHVRAAIYLFGGVYVGVALPLTAQTQGIWSFVSNTPKNAPGSWGGHAVPYLAYTSSTLTCVTWAHPMKLTYAFHDAYTQEAYAIVSPDWLNVAGRSPAGFDAAALAADLAAIGSP